MAHQHQAHNFKYDPARQNLFRFPHKAYRFMWLEVVQLIGSSNYTTEEALKKTSEIINFAIKAYTLHNAHESDFFAPRLKAKGGDVAKVVDDWIQEHDSHVSEMKELGNLQAAIVAETDLAKRKVLNEQLYEKASLFLMEDLRHMHWEETVVMGAFHSVFTDAELIAMEQEFLKNNMDPKEMEEITPMFLRSGNIDDRTFMLTAIKMSAPPQAFEGVLHGLAPTIIPAAELEQIKQRLSALPPAQPQSHAAPPTAQP